ncbi:MAG: type II methionyl aminopeptidase [Candidatus Aenigmarchaeota archaeon]|nr:type II methionyl aminopeptidase [Candidatus Aenigmarchaeota archaeon]
MDSTEAYKKAGRIHREVCAELRERLRPGMTLLEIAAFAEARIRALGGNLAFPVNTSLNDIAAHYVPIHEDPKTLQAGDLLKLDLGVRVDGYVADGAFTYCSAPSPLARAAEEAIRAAVQVIRPGVTVGQVSDAIEASVRAAGFGLIVNLTGHGVDQEQFHAEPTVPNRATHSPVILEEGMAIAIEPFVSPANGTVRDAAPVEIYRLLRPVPVRMPEARAILQRIQEEYGAFPFAKRWLCDSFSPLRVSLALKQLEAAGALERYPPLKDPTGQRIAQAEHTILVGDPPVVITG